LAAKRALKNPGEDEARAFEEGNLNNQNKHE